ncbi:MAG: hypothetical protein AAF657_29615 [Acidobacteriota bacterium]
MKPSQSTEAERVAALPDPTKRVDTLLRTALDPEPAVAKRLAKRALNTPAAVPARWTAPTRWQLTTAFSAAAVIALLWLAPRDQTVPPTPAPPPATEAVALVISNPNGLVTVTTTAGAKMVLLPDSEEPGDAS